MYPLIVYACLYWDQPFEPKVIPVAADNQDVRRPSPSVDVSGIAVTSFYVVLIIRFLLFSCFIVLALMLQRLRTELMPLPAVLQHLQQAPNHNYVLHFTMLGLLGIQVSCAC